MSWSESLICHSKINLRLKVTARREDGYHELASCFLPLSDPADVLTLTVDENHSGITLDATGFAVEPEANLVCKAAGIYAEKSGISPCWHFKLKKNIPVAAGMGGGSSDAATVLKLLNDSNNKPLSDKELSTAALELGADVPYFLDARPAIMTGIGEICTPLEFAVPQLHILLLSPQFPVSAAEGYRLMPSNKISAMSETLRNDILAALQNNDPEKLGKLIFNDLQEGVFNKYPILEMLSQEISSTGALSVLMTGSGPTLFALYSNRETLKQAQNALQSQHPEFKVFSN